MGFMDPLAELVLKVLEESPKALKTAEICQLVGRYGPSVWAVLRFLVRTGRAKRVMVGRAYYWYVRDEQVRDIMEQAKRAGPRRRARGGLPRSVAMLLLKSQIVALLSESPMPLTAEEVARALGKDIRLVRNALTSLVREGKLVSKEYKGTSCYYLLGGPDERMALSSAQMAVLACLAQVRRASSRRIAEELGWKQEKVGYTLWRLKKRGLVLCRGGLWGLTPSGRVLVRALGLGSACSHGGETGG